MFRKSHGNEYLLRKLAYQYNSIRLLNISIDLVQIILFRNMIFSCPLKTNKIILKIFHYYLYKDIIK